MRTRSRLSLAVMTAMGACTVGLPPTAGATVDAATGNGSDAAPSRQDGSPADAAVALADGSVTLSPLDGSVTPPPIDAGGGLGGTVDAGALPPWFLPDAAVPPPDAPPEPVRLCSTPVDYGDWGDMGGPAYWADDPSQSVTVRDAPDAVTRLAVFMLPGRGAFPNGLQTGTFTIDNGIENCGACMYLAMYSRDSGTFVAQYVATGGTITVTQMPHAGNEAVSFVATNVPFVATIGDVGCTTYIGRVAFSGTAIAP